MQKQHFLFLFLLSSFITIAQPSTQWTMPGDGASSRLLSTMDASGNIYVLGTYTGTLSLGGINLTALGSSDNFVGKINPDGLVLWLKSFGSVEYEQATDIEVNPVNGNIYVTGGFKGFFTEANITLVAQAKQDFFIGTLDNDGNWLDLQTLPSGLSTDDVISRIVPVDADNVFTIGDVWNPFPTNCNLLIANLNGSFQKTMLSDGILRGLDLDVDADKNLVVAGAYRGNGDIEMGLPTADFNNYDAFVGKLTSEGVWEWTTPFGLPGFNDLANGVVTDENGNIYVSGYFSGANTPFGNETHTPIGGQDIFISKLDTSGQWLWTKTFGGFSDDVSARLEYHKSSKSLVLCGNFTGEISFGAIELTATHTAKESFIARFTTNGEPLWARSFAGAGNNFATSAKMSNTGEIIVTGFMSDDIFTNEPNFELQGATVTSGTTFYLAQLLDETIVSAPEIAALSQLSIAPNPAKGHLSVRLSDAADSNMAFQLCNATGVLIQKGMLEMGQQELHFDLSAYPAGAYWLNFSQGGLQKSVKIVKTHD